MRVPRPALGLAAAALLGGACWAAWSALETRDAGRAPAKRRSAPAPAVSAAEREVDDIVDAVRRGRLSSALAGVVAFLRTRDPRELDAARRAAFDAAREEAGLWGLSEAERLANAGDADAAGAVLSKALLALDGTSREAEAGTAAARVRRLVEGIHAAAAAKARDEAMVPAGKATAAARAKAALGDPEGGLADLLLVLKTTTQPDAKAAVEKEVALLRKRVASKKDRQVLRKKADEAIAKGNYDAARQILRTLVDGAEEAGAGAEETALDREKLDGVKDLEENKEPDTLVACRKALRWLQAQQLSDGSFSSTLAKDDKGAAIPEETRKKGANRVGLTGLASLAFLGHVRYDLTDEFAPALQRSIGWLLATQKADGAFGGSLYEQSIATLALVESDRYFKLVKLKAQAVAGVVWLQKAQNDDGGWRYSPRTNPSDVSVTCWALQSLLHAKAARYEVTDEEESEAALGGKELRPRIQVSLERAFAYLDRMTDPVTKRVGYTNPGQGSPAMTAASLFCRLRYDQGPEDDRVRLAAEFVVGKDADGRWRNNAYGLFYASDAMSRLGGAYWKRWSPALKKTLLETQLKEGDSAGAWPSADDAQGKNGGVGPIFVVAMNALCLENFFEHRE